MLEQKKTKAEEDLEKQGGAGDTSKQLQAILQEIGKAKKEINETEKLLQDAKKLTDFLTTEAKALNSSALPTVNIGHCVQGRAEGLRALLYALGHVENLNRHRNPFLELKSELARTADFADPYRSLS